MSPDSKPGWGGRRSPPGGRPRAERRMQKTSVTLWPEQIKRLRALGNGSLSEGVRRVLAYHDKSAAEREAWVAP
jgi:hypothetical protein